MKSMWMMERNIEWSDDDDDDDRGEEVVLLVC
jgi:hypothetical protein